MSHVVSMRLKDNQMERLKRLARRLGKTPSETSALLIEEALRREEFAFIDFRNSIVGRQAYMQGSGLAIWEVIMIAQHFDMDAKKIAAYYPWSIAQIQAALNYYAAFPDEINEALEENRSYTFEKVKQMLPQAKLFVVRDEEDAEQAAGPLESEAQRAESAAG